MKTDVLVIGGGVIGLACTYELLRAGVAVRVLERDRVGAGASHGNMGLITPSHALPLNRPGMIRTLLRSMWRTDSPLYLRPRLDPQFLAWGMRFFRSCRPAAMLRTMHGRQALLESSRDLFVELVERETLDCEWETTGLLEIFAHEETMHASESSHAILEDIGVHSDELSREEVLKREPALRSDIHGGRFFPRDAQLRPEKLLSELARVVRDRGAEVIEGVAARGFEQQNGRLLAVETDRGRYEADQFLIATGAWSTRLCRTLGLSLPVQPGKGYSITTSRPAHCPRHPLLLSEANMAVTPWGNGMRLGGTMEFSGYNSKLFPTRLDALERGAKRFLTTPSGSQVEERWCGWRPMTPDELPILARLPRHENAVLATGHGMMGVSMAPATARIAAAMITGETPFLDPEPYDLSRF